MNIDRTHWLDHVKQVVRSRHYTWLPEGLGGEPVEDAMVCITADIMHVCKLAGISFQGVLDRARGQFEEEEGAAFPAAAPATQVQQQPPPEIDGDEVVPAYATNDVFDAEIVRGRLQSEGIACRVDSTSQGGFTELVDVKVLVHARDLDRAAAVIDHKPSSGETEPPSSSRK